MVRTPDSGLPYRMLPYRMLPAIANAGMTTNETQPEG